MLSGKIEEENIRYGSDTTFIEGLFALPDNKASFDGLKSLLEENGFVFRRRDDGNKLRTQEAGAQRDSHQPPRGAAQPAVTGRRVF